MAKHPPPAKRHHTERFRTPGMTKERWTHKQAALAGFMHANHYTSGDIARALGDGILPETVRAMISRRWKFPKVEKGKVVHVPKNLLPKLREQAAARGMTPEKYLRRILFIAIRDDLYSAIVPSGDG